MGHTQPRHPCSGSRSSEDCRGISSLRLSVAQERRNGDHQLRRRTSTYDDDQHAPHARPRIRHASRSLARGLGDLGERPRASRDTSPRSERTWCDYFCVMAARTRGSGRVDRHRPLNHQQIFLIVGRRDENVVCSNEAVDLAAHSDVSGEIDARLDREAYPRNERTLLPGLEVVDMRAGAVQVTRVDGVTGAVNEEISVSAFGDYCTRGIVDLAATHRLTRADSLLEQ